jgi:hypothetical protein
MRLWPKRNAPEGESDAMAFEVLSPVYERRFPGTDPERFVRLWCSLARMCGVSPTELHEDQLFRDLSPLDSRWSNLNTRMDDIEEFADAESGGQDVPERIDSVGTMMDWLLGAPCDRS